MSPEAEVLDMASGRPLDAEAVAALAEETAVKTEANRGCLETMSDHVEELRRGETSWQRGVDARLSAQASALDRIERTLERIEHATAIGSANTEVVRREMVRLILHLQTTPTGNPPADSNT